MPAINVAANVIPKEKIKTRIPTKGRALVQSNDGKRGGRSTMPRDLPFETED
jgi:hypothetical protein